jgi:2-dehydro-3-deoxyphosphooctonate aldolase (KDO 8-P synthase)
MQIAEIPLGNGAPLVLIAGLNVLEEERSALDCAEQVQALAATHALPVVFKASFDKANRTKADAFRGPGIDEGLRILAEIKRATGLPLLTDVHDASQVKPVSEIVDCLQVPAFLCRQTDLLVACAKTGRAVNLKKGQFVAPPEMRHAVEKLTEAGCDDVLVTERGASFGYNNLVADMRALVQMREFAPVCFDATHAVQYPGGREGASGGDRRFVAPLARAAVAVGVDALFVEAHPDPARAPVDGPSQIDFDALDQMLGEVAAIERAVGSAK